MTTTPARACAALTLAAALATGALAGCAGAGAGAGAARTTAANQGGQISGGSSSSRAHIYDSLDELLQAADLVLAGTAGAQQVLTDSPGSAMTFTVTDLAVDQVLRTDTTTAAAGSTVVVRQITTAPGWTSSEPEATLEPGQRYLLFLVHSALPGQAAAQYHPVGVVAGIYQGDGEAFTRAVPDGVDDLPATITLQQLRD